MKNQSEIIKGEEKGNQSIIEKSIDKGNSQSSKKEFKSELYSWNPSKKERGGLRRKRDSFIRKIMNHNEKKSIDLRNEEIENFKEFYKKNYLKNDYSLESLSSSNSKESNKEFIQDFLNHLKRWKIEL